MLKHRGELYLFLGALTFSVNGIVATVVLEHMSAFRLAQIRAISAFTLLTIFALIFRRELLKLSKKDIPVAIAYGVVGFALVNVGYFLGIERGLPLGLVLVLEFTAPIWIALWIKYVRKGFVAKDMWFAIALSLVGLLLVTKIWDGFKFDFLGLLGALGSAPKSMVKGLQTSVKNLASAARTVQAELTGSSAPVSQDATLERLVSLLENPNLTWLHELLMEFSETSQTKTEFVGIATKRLHKEASK